MSATPSSAFAHRALPKYNSEKWLSKHGWERGQGLGKNNQGRLDFVKVSKKDNTVGLGKPDYELKDFHWWDGIYTKAAQSVKINAVEGEEVKVVAAKEELKSEKKSVYDGLFVSGGTIEDERRSAQMRSNIKNEADLFAVCGNRDLRKFKQDGKAARLSSHDSSMKASIDHHKTKRLDSIYKEITDAEQRAADKEVEQKLKDEKKKEKKEKEKKKEANKKSAERKKKRQREQSNLSDSDSSQLPKKKKKKKKSS